MSGRYIAYRVAEVRRPYVRGQHSFGNSAYQRSSCALCREPVWVQIVNVEQRVIICWQCAGECSR